MDIQLNFNRELALEKSFRKYPFFIPLITLLTATFLVLGIYICILLFNNGQYWIILPAAILVHSFFIVVVHDAAHKSITRTSSDRLLLNIGSGIMLLPFYGEPFRKYHLIHHVNTNNHYDPLWPPFKKTLYDDKRWFYIIGELVPLMFTLYLVLSSKKQHQSDQKKRREVKVNPMYIVGSALISISVLLWVKPPVVFILSTLFVLNFLSALRHWCEHLGSVKNKESNTYWFPLGMGIGNHETHHQYAHLSWLTLMIGLFYRKKDTNPIKVLRSILFDKSFTHYTETLIEPGFKKSKMETI
nr:fatty acid desaturase [Pseudopedobacter sp.]